MHTAKEARQLDDYLRQVCQAIEKYDTQELLAYLADENWRVITVKEMLDIEKESTKELKLLALRRIIGQERSRVDKLREVLMTFASNIHKEVVAVLSSGDTFEHVDQHTARNRSTCGRAPLDKFCSKTEVFSTKMHSDVRKSDNYSANNYYEPKWNEFGLTKSFITKDSRPEEKCSLHQKKKIMALSLNESIHDQQHGNTLHFKRGRESSSDSTNSGSDLSGSPMDCSQVLPLETNKECRVRQTQSDIDYGYKSMTTLPQGLTQSSASTREYLYCNNPGLSLISPELTYCSASQSSIFDSRPHSRLNHAKLGMSLRPLDGPSSLQRLKSTSNSGGQRLWCEVEDKRMSSINRRNRHRNFTQKVPSRDEDGDSIWEQTGVHFLEPYSLTLEDKILKRNNGDLMQYMNMPSLLPHLYEKSLVTSQEYEILSSDKTTAFDKHGYFLQSVLPHKGPDAFYRLLQCFKKEHQHTGHKHLAELLEKEQEREGLDHTVSQSNM